MAVANVAWRLAAKGLRVAVVDWNFAAPGVHYFLPVPGSDEPSVKGLVDYFEDWKVALDTDAPSAPDFAKCVQVPRKEPLAGFLSVVLGTRTDINAAARLGKIDWSEFYEVDHGGGCVETLRARLIESHDVVLVDTESGVTTANGVSLVQLPDAVVYMSTLTARGLAGVLRTVRCVKEASAEERAGRPLAVTWLVIGRAPTTRDSEAWLHEHVGAICKDPVWSGTSVLVLPEVSRWAVGEHVVPVDVFDAVALGYDDLAGRISAWLKEPASLDGKEVEAHKQ